MKTFVEYVAQQLVDHPDQVSAEQEQHENNIIVRLMVCEEDLGKVIGRNGRNAQSIRTLLTAIGARQGKRAILEIASRLCPPD